MYTYYVVCVCERMEGRKRKVVLVCSICTEQNPILDKYRFQKIQQPTKDMERFTVSKFVRLTLRLRLAHQL